VEKQFDTLLSGGLLRRMPRDAEVGGHHEWLCRSASHSGCDKPFKLPPDSADILD